MAEKIEVDKAQLEDLLRQIEDFKMEAHKMKGVIINILRLLNLADEKGPKMEYFKDDEHGERESFFPPIIKGIGNVMTVLTKAQAPKWMGGEKAEKELKEMFGFLADIGPIIEKYSNGGK